VHPFGQSSGDQTNHTLMPAGIVQTQSSRPRFNSFQNLLGLAFGQILHFALNRAALAV